MRTGTLLVGELIHMYGLENVIGVVVGERREGVYDIHIFQDNRIFTFPRGMLEKLKTTEIA